jgi:hypothetical protein
MSRGPYRSPAPADPSVRASIEEALSRSRIAHRAQDRARGRFTTLAAAGYLAASPGREDDRASGSRTAAWTCVAAGATYALFLAGRAGARAHEIEAEIAGIERLSEALSRSPRG